MCGVRGPSGAELERFGSPPGEGSATWMVEGAGSDTIVQIEWAVAGVEQLRLEDRVMELGE